VKVSSSVCVVLIDLAIFSTAQEAKKEVKQAPMEPAPTASGKEIVPDLLCLVSWQGR
jgi:hypothetical protein